MRSCLAIAVVVALSSPAAAQLQPGRCTTISGGDVLCHIQFPTESWQAFPVSYSERFSLNASPQGARADMRVEAYLSPCDEPSSPVRVLQTTNDVRGLRLHSTRVNVPNWTYRERPLCFRAIIRSCRRDGQNVPCHTVLNVGATEIALWK